MTKLKPYVIAFMISLFGGQSFASNALKPCVTASYIRPEPAPPSSGDGNPAWLQAVPTNQTGCVHGLRLSAGPNFTIWRCQVVLPEDKEFAVGQSEHAFLIQHKDKPMQELGDDVMAGAYHNFELIKIDLDGNGQSENILAAWNGQSNGLGVNWWTINVFDAQWKLLKRFNEVADWGDSNLVAAPSGRRGCDIAITSYRESLNLGIRGKLALRADFFRLSGPAQAPTLTQASDRPTIERRLTNSFMQQRGAWFSQGEDKDVWQWRGDIASWLSHPSSVRTRD